MTSTDHQRIHIRLLTIPDGTQPAVELVRCDEPECTHSHITVEWPSPEGEYWLVDLASFERRLDDLERRVANLYLRTAGLAQIGGPPPPPGGIMPLSGQVPAAMEKVFEKFRTVGESSEFREWLLDTATGSSKQGVAHPHGEMICSACFTQDEVIVHYINGRCDRCGGTDWVDVNRLTD